MCATMVRKSLNMRFEEPSERGFGKTGAVLSLFCVALVVTVVFFARPLRRYVRESFMQSVTSAHYRVLCPPGAISHEAMLQFAVQREPLFTSLDGKLHDAASNSEIRVIFDPAFDPDFGASVASTGAAQPYEVTGAIVRTLLRGRVPDLDPAADAEALLHIVWGQPGS